MNRTFELEIELDNRNVIVQVECEYGIENDGIGPYEYWGSKEVDRGTDYIVIDNTDWDITGFTKEEIDLINAEIDKHLDEWSTQIGQRLSEDRADYSAYCDGEDDNFIEG